jgi:hypothetical protein
VEQIDRTRTEEVAPMSIPDNGITRAGVKTLAIRLEPDLHAQLSLIAQLRGSTITEEIRTAIDGHIAATKQNPDLINRADDVRAAIEADAAARREAIATLFGPTSPEETDPHPSPGRTRGRGTPGPKEATT